MTSAPASPTDSAEAAISIPLARQLVTSSSGRPAAAGSTAATSSRSAASTTAAQTVAPMRPAAPNTPTRIIASGEVGGHEGPDHRKRSRSRQHSFGHRSNVVPGYCRDAPEQVLHGEHAVEQQQAGAYARQTRPRVLEREEQI